MVLRESLLRFQWAIAGKQHVFDSVLPPFLTGRRTPPISTSLKTSHLQSELTVALYNADGSYTQPKEFDFAASQYDGWDLAWFGVALDSFDAEFEVEIDLSAAANGNYTLSLLQLSASYEGVGVEVDVQLYMTAEAAASMSFTTGLELSVSSRCLQRDQLSVANFSKQLKKPMGIMIPALDPILQLNESKGINMSVLNIICAHLLSSFLIQPQ